MIDLDELQRLAKNAIGYSIDGPPGNPAWQFVERFTPETALYLLSRVTDKETVDHDLEAVGSWMSAALDDPKVCDEMKEDIYRYLAALERNGLLRTPDTPTVRQEKE